MKKLISVLLCLCMVSSAVMLLAGCRQTYDFTPVQGQITASEEMVAIDLTGYVMSYDTAMSATARKEAASVVSELRSLCGVSISIREDMAKTVEENDGLEILIGNTKRTQTAEALDYVKNHGWAIVVCENKLVITGTTALMTRLAMQYLAENYLSADYVDGSVLTIPSAIVYSDMEVTALFEDRSTVYNVVYDDQYDDVNNVELNPSYTYERDPNPDGGKETDEIYNFSVALKEPFSKASGMPESTLKLTTDAEEASEYEVLVGNMDRADVKKQHEGLAANEYGVSIEGSKIYLLAWNAVALKSTTALLEEILSDCVITNGDGLKSYVAPKSVFFKSALAKNTWKVDFPKPEGENIVLDGTIDVQNNSLEYIYSGTGVNTASFTAYCQKLEAAGYKLLPGSATQKGKDLYRHYVKEADKTSLYVYLSNYEFASQYHITDVLPSIRIIASNTDGEVDLPDASILDSTAYDNRTYPTISGQKSMITQLKHDYSVSNNFGNAYFYTLADGSFVVYDGGVGKANEAENMWNAMEAMYEKMHGYAPDSGNNRIHIRAWWISHEHGDHHTVLTKFLETYGEDIKMDYLMYNFTSASERFNSNNPGTIPKNIAKMKDFVSGGFKFIKLHTGQTFYFVNLKFEVMYTHEDTYPKGLEYFNNSSTVIRGTLRTTDASGNPTESTCLWLGDLERIGGRRLLAAYGPSLDCDMVQVAHHGWNGLTKEMYDVIAPEVVWWPTSRTNFINWCNQGATTHKNFNWFFESDRYIAYGLKSVKVILIADMYNTTMTITGTAADYDNLIDAAGTGTITYCTLPKEGTSLNKDRVPTAAIDKRT